MPAGAMDDVAVVVVTWNAADTIEDCLRSVLANGVAGLAVVVVDNASSDGTPERVRELARTDPRLRFLSMGRNAGFGAACNAGASLAARPLALFLNPDARLAPDALERMAERMRADPSIAVAGAWSRDARGLPWLEAGRLPGLWREAVDKARHALRRKIGRAPAEEEGDLEVEWVSGACMLVRLAAIPGPTLFDERYFLYFEDKDLCARARAATGRVVVVGGARLVHVGGAGARQDAERTAVAYRESQVRYYAKHRDPAELLALRIVLSFAFVARAALALVLPHTTRFGPRLSLRLVRVLWRDAAAPALVGDPGVAPVTRVLLVIASGGPGGGTTHVEDLLGQRDRRRFDVALACGTDGALACEAMTAGVRVFPIDFMRSRFGLQAWRALARAIEAFAPHVIHAHGARGALAAAVARRIARGPRPLPRLLYTEHGLSFEPARGLHVALPARFVERTVGALGAEAIALSHYSARLLGRLGTFSRVTVIPNMVHVPDGDPGERRRQARSALGIDEDAVIVGTVMRLVPQKAPERFVEVAARILGQRPATRLVIIGDGPLRPEVERLIAARGAAGRVTLAGARPAAASLLPAFDVFALLSRWEGLPISILEAQAAGVPVVATCVGGVAELLEGGCGLGVPAVHPEDGAVRAILALLDDAALRGAIGAAAKTRVAERHAPKVVAGAVADLWAGWGRSSRQVTIP